MNAQDTNTLWTVLYIVGSIVGVSVIWGMWGYQHWKVWAAHQSGLADLTKARNEQQIQIAQADSRLAAASKNKEAAIIEAQAVAAQIEAIGKQLTAHDLYLKWQWIKMMEDTAKEGNQDTSVIYVPTEANIPVLEAMRLKVNKPEKEEEE